jgi:quinolinate synthase
MGQSVKILAPQKKVCMPRLACCSMAKMIDAFLFDSAIKELNAQGIFDILPVVYINSTAEVKAKVGQMNGYVCTSANAAKIMEIALKQNKKILFAPDRCLGVNISNQMGVKSCVLGDGVDLNSVDVVCFDGFCAIHQLFTVDDVEFYRQKYKDILIAVHPECDPSVVALADFVGSTSQIINFVHSLDENQKVAVGTEFNLVNRLRKSNTYILSSTKPQCPTMSETTIEDLHNLLLEIKNGKPSNEIMIGENIAKDALIALENMFAL